MSKFNFYINTKEAMKGWINLYKIRKINFHNHKILGDLVLNFCDQEDKAVDTIILAGENGTGKSTILNELYSIASHNINSPCTVEFEDNSNNIFTIDYYFVKSQINYKEIMYAEDNQGFKAYVNTETFKQKYPFTGIYSDVDINFNTNPINTVTSMVLDSTNKSRRSTNNFPTEIKQLLIDIQAADDSDVAQILRTNKSLTYNDVNIEERMLRFTNAFNIMFENLTYSKIINNNNHKEIIFKKFSQEFPIDFLSSGEKQIVYRGSFLLKDINALSGAFVFIDEPEISLHPNWQKNVLDFYKNIFTDSNGKQTSQLFIVTHSPFIIHNEKRQNDKVIILFNNHKGKIEVKDKPDYYKCNSIEAVKDAFSIPISQDKSYVYVEGRTDEKYFQRAIEVFGYEVSFEFKWIGYIDENGQEANTGATALDRAVQFLISKNLSNKNICLYDCDTNRGKISKNNIYTMCIPQYQNAKNIKKGLENALILDNVELSNFYIQREEHGNYGETKIIEEFQKMRFCEYICSKNNEELKEIFKYLKEVIDDIITILET